MVLSELFIFLFFLLFFRRQGFRMITFDRQAGPLQNFSRSHVMVIGRSVSFSDPARPPGGKHPKIPPSVHAFQNPRNIFFLKLEKKLIHFSPPPQIFFVCVLRPQEDVFAGKKFQLLKTSTPPPPPPRPRPALRTLTSILVQYIYIYISYSRLCTILNHGAK